MTPTLRRGALAALALVMIGGCSAKEKRVATRDAAPPAAATDAADTSQAVSTPQKATAPTVVVIKRGLNVTGKLDTTLDSGKNTDGDTFSMPLAPGVFGKKAFKGAVLEGHVEGVKAAGKMGKKGVMDVMFDDIRLADGAILPVEAKLASAPKAEGKKLRNAALVIGGAVAGHHIGKRMGKKHGLLAGAAAGAAVALVMPGGNVVLRSGAPLSVKFTQDVRR